MAWHLKVDLFAATTTNVFTQKTPLLAPPVHANLNLNLPAPFKAKSVAMSSRDKSNAATDIHALSEEDLGPKDFVQRTNQT